MYQETKDSKQNDNVAPSAFINSVKTDNGLVVIGDVHGKVNEYWKILNKLNGFGSIQVGDFGFKKQHDWHLKNMDSNYHKINFGNHDYYPYLTQENSLRDFSYNTKHKIMTIRGAFSIDRVYRTENLDWFSNEELKYNDMQKAVDFYNSVKPKIMITHDCPSEICNALFGIRNKPSITCSGLQVMFENHQPDFWIFGHHHKSKNEVINGTRFICLAELEKYFI